MDATDSGLSDESWTPSESMSGSEPDDIPPIESEANQLADIDVLKKIIKDKNSKKEKRVKSKKEKKEK